MNDRGCGRACGRALRYGDGVRGLLLSKAEGADAGPSAVGRSHVEITVLRRLKVSTNLKAALARA